jgi:hypothetical protein
MRAALLPLLAGACTYQESRFETTLPSEGVTDVFCDLEAGSFVYSGSGTAEAFTVGVASWAEGSSEGRADKRIANNDWGAQVSDGLLDLWGRSPVRRSGVDVAVLGPPQVNVEAVLLDGTVELYDVDGSHVVTANGVVGGGISGDVDLYASLTGISVQVFPRDDSTLRFEAFGDVWIELPYGLDYDLEVFADPDWGVEVQDLGFTDVFVAPDYVSAVTGDGSITVDVFVSGGTFHLWQAVETTLSTTPTGAE